jgi:hypothetical protein
MDINQVLELIKPLIETFLGKQGWFLQVIAIMGTFRLFFKPFHSFVKEVIQLTPSKKDDEVLEKIEGSKIAKSIVWVIDFLFSIKVK